MGMSQNEIPSKKPPSKNKLDLSEIGCMVCNLQELDGPDEART